MLAAGLGLCLQGRTQGALCIAGKRAAAALALTAALALVAAALCATASGGARRRVSNPPQRRVFLLGLPQRGNPAAVASAVSSPGSRIYRRFLSLRQYQHRFAPSGVAIRRVLGYLKAQRGVLRTELSSDRSVVLAVLTAQAGQRIFCAKGPAPPTGGLCKPPALRPWVRQLSASELYAPRASSARAGAASRSSQTCPGAVKTRAFNPHQLSSAYQVDPLRSRRLDGSGVRVATLSSQEVDTAGFRTWARCFGLPTPSVRQLAMPGATRDTGTAPEETVLDVEALASLAPHLRQITPIFVPLDQSFSNSFVLFMFGALNPSRQLGRLPDVLSISDGVCEDRFTRDQLQLGERLLIQAAALGITTLAASGDLGFQGCFTSTPGSLFPSSSPFVTSVGGTDLTLTGGNRIAKQVVWSTYATQPKQGVGSGGGPSKVWPRPSFQRGPGIGPALQRGRRTRLAPDIGAMAAFKPGLAVYDKDGGGWGLGGGTSAATPLEAAIVALALQQERRAGRPPLGSLPPLLYSLARGPRNRSIFYDVIKGTSSRHPSSAIGRTPAGGAAQPGYDLATGLGSLNAAAFAAAIASQGAGAGGPGS